VNAGADAQVVSLQRISQQDAIRLFHAQVLLLNRFLVSSSRKSARLTPCPTLLSKFKQNEIINLMPAFVCEISQVILRYSAPLIRNPATGHHSKASSTCLLLSTQPISKFSPNAVVPWVRWQGTQTGHGMNDRAIGFASRQRQSYSLPRTVLSSPKATSLLFGCYYRLGIVDVMSSLRIGGATSTPSYILMSWCLIKPRGNFTPLPLVLSADHFPKDFPNKSLTHVLSPTRATHTHTHTQMRAGLSFLSEQKERNNDFIPCINISSSSSFR
jgi:hypothetical protein